MPRLPTSHTDRPRSEGLCAPILALLAALAVVGDARAQDPPAKVIPPKGINVPAETRAKLVAELADFKKDLDALPGKLAGKPDLLALVPDVEVYFKAVDWALRHDEFYTKKEIDAAPGAIKQGRERARLLADGKAPWKDATGLVVRGYRSKIDGSVQPYGLVVPKDLDRAKPARLDLWWHGRGETLSELAFVMQRQSSAGEFAPATAIVLHPYGRYCNANKFAGEVDTFEAIEAVKRDYKVDENRVVARGFSMGGAACWQYATHFPGFWAAANPGAGFADTPTYLNLPNGGKGSPWYEQRLWHWYNATDYAGNLANLPTVAYSGEVDPQKKAADMMAAAMKKEGLDLVHVIGPKTGHKYEPKAKAEVAKQVDALAAAGRKVPARVYFTTHTLRYPESHWVRVEGLGKHWQRAWVEAGVKGGVMTVTTENVTKLTITATEQGVGKVDKLVIDGQAVGRPAMAPTTSRPHSGPGEAPRETPTAATGTYDLSGTAWQRRGTKRVVAGLEKKPGLQGPIDDAFLDRFVFVRPTGTPLGPKTGAWVDAELKRAVDQWRKQFRGDAVVVDDTAVTDEMIANANLVLWGDALSNKVIGRMANGLPAKWVSRTVLDADGKPRVVTYVEFGGSTYSAGEHVPILIHPNPLNPSRYLVLNSGFTFREDALSSNAKQVPKLPDYAIVDVTTPPSPRAPGKVVRAGFFGENWELLPKDGE